MNEKKWRLLHLHRCRGVTRPLIRKLLTNDPALDHIYNLSQSDFYHLLGKAGERSIQIQKDLQNKSILYELEKDVRSYHTITLLDKTYPAMLKHIKDAPIALYGNGNQSLLQILPALSVVGTRVPSFEAKKKMNYILAPLIKKQWTIVSGMARGIDGLAHRLSVEHGGKTIAVLGGGFHHIYPKEHTSLYKKLASDQLVLSEYPPNSPPKRFHFPERNRIISGLSFGTLVIEAKEKSGTLITVEQALDQGREVYAVPGSILSPQTSGCHRMIQEGAKLVQNTYDLIEDWDNYREKWRRFLSDFEENDYVVHD